MEQRKLLTPLQFNSLVTLERAITERETEVGKLREQQNTVLALIVDAHGINPDTLVAIKGVDAKSKELVVELKDTTIQSTPIPVELDG